MADSMEVDEGLVRHLLPVDSVKMMGESVGVGNLNDDAAVKLSEDLEYRLKELVQEAVKFMHHSKRRRLLSWDLDRALRVKNVEPLYGFDTEEYIPFRHTSGGGKDLYYPDEKEVGLLELVNAPLPRLSSDVTLRAHWLCVEGVQPVIPENPAPMSLQEQQDEASGSSLPSASSTDPVFHLKRIQFDKKGKKREEAYGTEWSKLKPLQAHSLSLEQQLYYKEITDACIGVGSESRWQEALNSLSTDPGIYQLLPQFTSFITEGIKVNIGQRKLMVLKHLVKMIGSLLDNQSLSLAKFLHDVIPALVSCLVSKQLCVRPESEDHWTLRESAAKILAKICKRYSDSTNNIQPRVTRALSQVLRPSHGGGESLAVHYGAAVGLVELGPDVISSLLVPKLKQEGALIRAALAQPGKGAEHVAGNKLQSLLIRHCAPVLLSTRSVADMALQYQNEYGSLGQALFNQVKTLRQNRAGIQGAGNTSASSLTPRLSGLTTAAKSPSVTLVKTKPPPLSLSTTPVMAIRTSSSKPQSPALVAASTPTLAAALQLVSQAAKSAATPTSATPSGSSLSLLSAVINSPVGGSTLAEQLTAALSRGSNGNSSAATPTPPVSRSPKATPPPTPALASQASQESNAPSKPNTPKS